MPSIHTLVPDIYQLLKETQDGWFTDGLANDLSTSIARRLQGQLGERRTRPTLRLSQMGARCPRALWYSLHHPELAEPFPPWAKIKFAYGSIIEALIIPLAKAAGHEVTGEQDELRYEGIVGHRDCVIDGCTVDIKSAASLSFQKFKTMDYSLVDNFGYLEQLDGYVLAAADDPLVRVKDRGFLLPIDKQHGHLHLYEHHVTGDREQQLKGRIRYYKAIQAMDHPPACECRTESIGNSGNIKLHWTSSYSAYKWECFPQLRAFKYAEGPVYLSKVNKRPLNKYGPIPEFDRHGKTIYH